MQISSVQQEGVFRGSRWIRHALFLTQEEMEEFLSPDFHLFCSGQIVNIGEERISREVFLKRYQEYLQWMQEEPGLPSLQLQRFFTMMLTTAENAVYAVEIAERVMVKERLPVVQLRMQTCFFSKFDQQIHLKGAHPDSFAWGLEFSYPQIYEDPKTHQFHKVFAEERFPNSALFKDRIGWIRTHTQLLPFQGKYLPLRMGKQAGSLVEKHRGFQRMLHDAR